MWAKQIRVFVWCASSPKLQIRLRKLTQISLDEYRHLHKIIKKRRPAAQVGQLGAGGSIAIVSARRIAIPPDARRDDNAGSNRIADAGLRFEAAAVVEGTHTISI